MLALIGLDNMAPDSLAVIGVVALLAAILVGFLSHSLMGESGFGVIGNAVLSVLAVAAAVAVWRLYLTPFAPGNMLALIAFAAACVAVTLLGLAFVKRFA